ncbi:MAG: DNA adenine methylase [Gammaproteobacteria bacterium]|nr:DNA adenine methylase [Gammaproteobacteria bacterium]
MRNKRPAKVNIGIEINPKVIQMWRTNNTIGFELIHGDAVKFIESYQFRGRELLYCDPPYLRQTRKKRYSIYKNEYTYDQHIKLLEAIKTLPCMVMISGYKSRLYEESLRGWHTYSFQAGCHHGVATEYIWMNYPAPVELHDYCYLGNTFRERERIRMKLTGWTKRIISLPVLQRQALLGAIKEI